MQSLRVRLPRQQARETLLVTVVIQLLIIAGLSFGEYPEGRFSPIGGLIACYIAVDIGVHVIGSATGILSRLWARVFVYLLPLVVCIAYGSLLRILTAH
jgi:hypothetical protein